MSEKIFTISREDNTKLAWALTEHTPTLVEIYKVVLDVYNELLKKWVMKPKKETTQHYVDIIRETLGDNVLFKENKYGPRFHSKVSFALVNQVDFRLKYPLIVDYFDRCGLYAYIYDYVYSSHSVMPVSNNSYIRQYLIYLYNQRKQTNRTDEFINILNNYLNDKEQTPDRLKLLFLLDLLYALIKRPTRIMTERDTFYNLFLRYLRGPRRDVPTEASMKNSFGITQENILPLLNSVSWPHWSSICQFDKHDPRTIIQNPICGISGSSGMAFWDALPLNLWTPTRLLLFTMGIFIILCQDGGHSIQEVFASLDVFLSYYYYIYEFLKHNNPENDLYKTLDNLHRNKIFQLLDGFSAVPLKENPTPLDYTKIFTFINNPSINLEEKKKQIRPIIYDILSYMKINRNAIKDKDFKEYTQSQFNLWNSLINIPKMDSFFKSHIYNVLFKPTL
jgi:hypothetical protein